MTAPRIFTPEYYARMRALETGGWWNAAMRDVQALLLDRIGLPPEGTLLDVGCGSGQTIDWFRTLYPRWHACGADIAMDGLRAGHTAGRAGLVAGSALALPFPNASVDCIICLDVLQHLPFDGGDVVALAEMRRVLRPDGRLIVRTNAQAFPRTTDDRAAAFHKYEPAELRAKLGTAGFRVWRLSRANAVLGLAEIPRELRARRREGSGYHGLLAAPEGTASFLDPVKRGWLRVEGRLMARGLALPLGRTLLAVCTT